MNSTEAVNALGALAQEHRLALFRLLVRAGPDGLAAGAVAQALGVPNSSLSFHLAQLHRAGLVRQQRRGRSLVYSADYPAMNALVGYLMENCCAGAACAAEERKSA
jgi:ArsR family transcriptional regulator